MTQDRDPADLAADVVARPTPLLVGLDVDGVLAPIVAHADDARLLPGIAPVLRELARLTPMAIVSGRRLADLAARFELPDDADVFGTHGAERRGHAGVELDGLELAVYRALEDIAADAVAAAGEGAWVEAKPASVVIHVRQADPDRAGPALEEAERAAGAVPGAYVKAGKAVLELLARPTSKADAIATLRDERAAGTVVFVGDDHTDEEVFATLGDDDVAVRVGPGETRARLRLPDPAAVLVFLEALTARLADVDDPADA